MLIELLTSKYPGMRLWLSQRLTALLMAVYITGLIAVLLCVKPNSYLAWHAFASSWIFKVCTLMFFVSLSMHAWLGVRDVLRDYIFNKTLRGYMQVLVDFLLFIYFIWISIILWNS